MSLIIPDPRFEMPGLFEPGRPPTGPVVVNQAHPLGRHAKYFFAGGLGSDLILPGGFFTDGARSIAGVAEFDNDSKYQYSQPVLLLDQFTLIFKIRRDSIGFDGLFGDKSNSNWSADHGISANGITSSSAGYSFIVGPSTNALTINNSSVSVGDWHSLALTYTSGATHGMKMFINGTQIGARTPTSHYSKSAVNARIGTYYSEGASWSWDGAVEYVQLLDIDLSNRVNLLRGLIADPYQFLIPA